MMKPFAALFLLLAGASAAFGQEKTIAPEETQKHLGQSVTVKGLVSSDTTSQGGNRFLNMGGSHPNHVFAGWIPAQSAAVFAALSDTTGKTCAITGKVQPYHGKPEIALNAASQVVCD